LDSKTIRFIHRSRAASATNKNVLINLRTKEEPDNNNNNDNIINDEVDYYDNKEFSR
jgi:hypothetical protein